MSKEGLILTGFMGMGKSTVGSRVAEQLGIAYFDTDDWIEASGVDVPGLVKTAPREFRKVEAQALRTLLEQEPGVISTGGGIVSTEFGRAALKGADIPIVWLKANFFVAERRVERDSRRERPLFSDGNTAKVLFVDRQPWYQETATHVINADQPIVKVVEDIVAVVS